MKTHSRQPKRNKTKIKLDIDSSSKIVREDVYDVIREIITRGEAERALREFLGGVDDSNGSFKRHGKRMAIERIISDLDSYKEWKDE